MSVLLAETKTDRQLNALISAKTTRMLLRLIRARQPISRVEIARRLEVNRSTVTDIVKPLINAGIVREEPYQPDDANRAQGRPPIGLFFKDEDDFFVGLNLGVRHSQVGLATMSGEVLAEEEFETAAAPEEALKTARKKIENLCAEIENRTLRTIGVSVPGPTDKTRRKLLYAPHLGWRDVDITDALMHGLS